ncbi:hypothetical protein FS842_005800, partial [Serendipita sp. 407]
TNRSDNYANPNEMRDKDDGEAVKDDRESVKDTNDGVTSGAEAQGGLEGIERLVIDAQSIDTSRR